MSFTSLPAHVAGGKTLTGPGSTSQGQAIMEDSLSGAEPGSEMFAEQPALFARSAADAELGATLSAEFGGGSQELVWRRVSFDPRA
jgi:hypothetical protein